MKKILALILAALMVAAMLAGCKGQENPDETLPDDVLAGQFTFPTLKPPTIREDPTEPEDPDALPPMEIETYSTVTNTSTLKANDLKYVLIYNPDLYDEKVDTNFTRSSGAFGKQINVDMGRADGLQEDLNNMTVGQDDLNKDIPYDQLNLDGNRAGAPAKIYKVGDTKTFYTYDNVSTQNPRITQSFSCRYAGAYCNIWVAKNIITDATAKEYGADFDANIYNQMVEAFGEPRFADQGGKVNLLYYALPSNLGGCFCMLDIFTADEIRGSQLEGMGCNTDMALLHINGTYAANSANKRIMTSTMAHEFQHLIAGTDYFYTMQYTTWRSWMNEAMSGYVEEMLFPGVQEENGRYTALHRSNLIRKGQSMYNFYTAKDPEGFNDIGVYGSVYLFSQYLARLGGEDVFSKAHSYWRDSYSVTLSEGEAIAESIGEDAYNAINDSIRYPDSLFISIYDGDIFLSKLILQFYLEMLDSDETDPAAFELVDPSALFYNEINPAQIEGGGRILIALKGNSYTIPSDASHGLFYVGLNEDFEVVTPLVFQ